jgi:glycosyltransferase involved in cell wall biosynthesis
MKICISVSSLGHGGAERVGVVLANGFSEKGHDVIVITDVHEKVVYQLRPEVRIVPFSKSKTNKFMKWSRALYNTRATLKKEKPDVVIGIMQLCSLISRIASIGLSVPVVMTEHSAFEWVSSLPRPWFLKFSRKYLNWIYPCVTVLTEPDKQFIGNKLKNVVVMHNPLTYESYEGELNKEKLILSAGRLTDWRYKGWDTLVYSWARIADKYPDWKICIAGTGAESSKQYIIQLMKDNGIEDRVEFLGHCKNMLELYRRASIFFLSSRSEGMPMVVLEAMSQGCACVATDYKGRTKRLSTRRIVGYCVSQRMTKH